MENLIELVAVFLICSYFSQSSSRHGLIDWIIVSAAIGVVMVVIGGIALVMLYLLTSMFGFENFVPSLIVLLPWVCGLVVIWAIDSGIVYLIKRISSKKYNQERPFFEVITLNIIFLYLITMPLVLLFVFSLENYTNIEKYEYAGLVGEILIILVFVWFLIRHFLMRLGISNWMFVLFQSSESKTNGLPT